MFSHRSVLKKPFFLSNLPQGILFCQNKSQLLNLQNGHREMFFNAHFWPFKNKWIGQKSCFLIRGVLKNLFFYLTSHQGVFIIILSKSHVLKPSFFIFLQLARQTLVTPHVCPCKNQVGSVQKSWWVFSSDAWRLLKEPFFQSHLP